ncbi:hypothetical protein [Sphingobium yanoikuyae]|uniref:Uncharacterized protein n=1 Tax=Sphingobium yanoikuyae TaxID=13690 RepID=A0A291MY83_SPHYA|nr:hypothetical protein [Sphingobium yanoikuyae]ATI79860.1 hypothetical protein A6768_07365 [Sphingobium yanoikuyae]
MKKFKEERKYDPWLLNDPRYTPRSQACVEIAPEIACRLHRLGDPWGTVLLALEAGEPVMATATDLIPHSPITKDGVLLEPLPAAIYVCNEGVMIRYNKRTAELWGIVSSPAMPRSSIAARTGSIVQMAN